MIDHSTEDAMVHDGIDKCRCVPRLALEVGCFRGRGKVIEEKSEKVRVWGICTG